VVTKTKAISDINAYQTYIDALDNPYTRKNYEIHFSEFRKALKASESCNELLKMDGRKLEDKIVEHIKQMAKAGASTSSIRLTLSAVRKFFVENRQENRVNWTWLKGRIPKSNGRIKDRDYTKEELVKMWEQSDIRKKAILSLLMTGIRKGAIPDLRVGSLAKIIEYRDREGRQHRFESHYIYKLTVYEGSDSEYVTFLTPAGAKAVDRYIEARTMAGEKVTANSPLIRDAFDSVNADASQPKPVTLAALDMAFTRLTRSVGIRPKEKKEEEGRKKRRRQDRHDIMLFHGIRKYVNHALVNAGCNMIAKELLIGHAAPGLEGSYLRPTEEELLAEFVKAIPALSLSQESELRQQVDRLRVEVADIDVLKEGYLELKEDNRHLQEQIAALIEASKRAAENKRILDDTEPPLASA
jgi:site-specific recombinase XerD